MSSWHWQRENRGIVTRGREIENEDVEHSRYPIYEKCWPMAHDIRGRTRHVRTKIGVEYVHALKMVDRSRERIVSFRITGRYLKTPSTVEYSVHEASFVLATSSFVTAFSRENFERIPTLLTNLLIPLGWLAMRFFHFHELAAVSPGFPPSWLRQMACIYFTARQPVDFSFLHYASPSLSIFFSLLPSLDAFPPRFSSLPLSHRFVVLPSSIFPFRPSRAF